MQPAQDWLRKKLADQGQRRGIRKMFWPPLLDALMRPGSIIVIHIFLDYSMQLLLVKKKIWSKHSRLRLPMNRSQIAFALGERKGVFNSWMPLLVAVDENADPYLVSRSRIKYLGPVLQGVASRNCWAVQTSVGLSVTAE